MHKRLLTQKIYFIAKSRQAKVNLDCSLNMSLISKRTMTHYLITDIRYVDKIAAKVVIVIERSETLPWTREFLQIIKQGSLI